MLIQTGVVPQPIMYVHSATTHTHSVLLFRGQAHAPGGRDELEFFLFLIYWGQGSVHLTLPLKVHAFISWYARVLADPPRSRSGSLWTSLYMEGHSRTWELQRGQYPLIFKGNSNQLVFWSQSLSWFQLSLEIHVPQTAELYVISM